MNRTRGRVLVWVPLCARSFSPSAGLLGSLPGLSSRAHARFKQCLAMALRRGRGPPTSFSNNGNTCAAIEMHAPSTLRNPTPPQILPSSLRCRSLLPSREEGDYRVALPPPLPVPPQAPVYIAPVLELPLARRSRTPSLSLFLFRSPCSCFKLVGDKPARSKDIT